MYNQFQPTQSRPTPGVFKGRPVASIDEARATPIDFDGSVFYFPDYTNKCIYTKQINLDGTVSFLMYELKEIPVVQPPNYITREEFEKTITQLKNYLATPQQNSVVEPKQEFNF